MPHRLIVHCGLHKTGSTALQHFLTAATAGLRGLGVLVPQAGRVAEFGGGHHNIAWELARDRRYRRARGGVAELVAEIAAFDGDAVISSEDFENCLSEPARIAPLLRHPRLADRQVVLLLYLRDQVSYAEGLYTENLAHGLGDEAGAAMQTIVERGEWRWREWRFQFDYFRLLRTLEVLAPAHVLVRPYCPPGPGGGIVMDMLSVCYPQIRLAPGTDLTGRVNERWPLGAALALFLANRLGEKPDPAGHAVIAGLASLAGDAAPRLSPHTRKAFIDRFQPGNDALMRAHALPPAALAASGRPEAGALALERVFSFETAATAEALAATLRRQPSGPGPGPGAGPGPLALPQSALFRLAATVEEWRIDRAAPGG